MGQKRQKTAQAVLQKHTVNLPNGRKLRAATIVEDKPPEVRFVESLDKDSSWCCYGQESTLKALEFYAVDELLIAEDALPNRLDIDTWHSYWETLAAERKVARLHWISAGTPQGRNFCRSFRVAGILGRPLDMLDDLSPMDSRSSSFGFMALKKQPSTSEEATAALGAEVSQLARAVSNNMVRAVSNNSSGSRAHPPSAHDAFFSWLRRALCSELPEDEMSALALFDCAYVILSGLEECCDLESHLPTLEDAAGVLAVDAPSCASELQIRWMAAQFAESDIELSAITEVSSALADRLPPSLGSWATASDLPWL